MLMAGPDPVVCRPPAHQNPDNDLDDEHPMDEDECLDFADQEPLPFPFTLIVPDFVYNIIPHWHIYLSLQQQ